MIFYARTLLFVALISSSLVILQAASATHGVSADPAAGVYSSPQSVVITATENSTIYFTIDGSVPSNASEIYMSPIEIATNITLRFFSIATSDNHVSAVVTEVYTIDSVPPFILESSPIDGQIGADAGAIINVTFSEAMDDSTIGFSTFIVENKENLQYFGSVSFDAVSNTATFVPDFLDEANHYIVTLTMGIKDRSGNNLEENHQFTFSTGPDMGLRLFQHDPSGFQLLGGGAFTITPDPFDLSGSLLVADNQLPDSDPSAGSIFLNNVKFGTYVVSQTGIPAGFGNIFDNVTITAHDTLLLPRAEFRNRNLTIPVSEFPPAIFVAIPPPDLTSDQFEFYRDGVQVGTFLGFEGGLTGTRPINTVGPGELPGGTLETATTLDSPETTLESVVFDTIASPGTSAGDLFATFMIPTYPDIDPSLVNDAFYFVPAYVIPYGNTGNNFMLTPLVGHVRPGMTLVLEQPSYIESEEASVERVNMTLNAAGNDIGFSFAVTDDRPPGTPNPPLDVKALFLDVDFTGSIDFSDPEAFESSPIIDILVNKTLSGFDQLQDGCVDFRLLLFNEDTEEWDVVDQLRNPTRDTDFQCGFTLLPEHFSKFAVGGVKGQTISTESSDRNSNGGGGVRSTTVTQTPTGNNIQTSVRTQSGEVLVRFESVDEGSGQLKINTDELSSFEEYFSELAYLSQDNDQHGITDIDGRTYSTAGRVYDIDASAVKFEGKINVTIPYDEDIALAFGPESSVKFIYFNDDLDAWEDKTKSIDEITNTVTGELWSLSPVTSAIILDGSSQNEDLNLDDNTMLRVKPRNLSFSQSDGAAAMMSIDLSNNRPVDQEYILLVQIVDQNNIVQYIDWKAGSLEPSSKASVSISWNDIEKGNYRAQVLILTGMNKPYLLAQAVYSDLSI